MGKGGEVLVDGGDTHGFKSCRRLEPLSTALTWEILNYLIEEERRCKQKEITPEGLLLNSNEREY